MKNDEEKFESDNSNDTYKSIRTEEEKKIHYYSAIINGWINTKFERDRSLLTLSTGGIGLLITLLTTVGVVSLYQKILYSVSLILFLVCVICVITIYGRNAKYLARVVKGDDTQDEILKCLDKLAFWSFLLAIIASCAIGITSFL